MAKEKEVKIKVSVFNQDFNKSMKEMSSESSKLNREFKLQQEQMKHTATDAQKLAAKVDFLKKKHELAKQKVAETREQYEKAKEQYGENSKAAQDLAKKLDSARIEEQQLANQIKETNDELKNQKNAAQKVGEKMKEMGGKIKDVGKDLSMKVTAPIVGLGGAATKMAIDQENAFAQVSTLLDESTTDFQKYKESIRAVSSELGISFEDYALAVYNAMSAGQAAGDAVEFTRKAVMLAGGGFTTTTNAVDVLTTTLNAYKLKTEDTMKISDMLITTQNLGKTTVDALSQSMGSVIPVAQANNVGFNQLATGYAVLTKNGIATAEAGTYLKGMFSELGKTGTKADEALRKISGKSFSELQGEGKSVADVLKLLNDHAEKSGLKISDLFGNVRAGSAALVLAQNDGAEFTDVLKQMDGSAGATDKAFAKMTSTAKDKLAIAMTKLKNTMAQLGEIIMPIVAKLAEKVGNLATKFSNLSPATKKIILIIAGVAAAIGPLLVIIGTLLSSVGSIITAFGAVSGVIAGAGGAMVVLGKVFAVLTGPIGLTIAAVVGLIAIFVALWKNNEDFRNKVIEIWESIKNGFQVALDFIWGIVQSVMSNVMDFFGDILGKIQAFWAENGQGIMEIVSNTFQSIWGNIQMIMGIIKGIFQVVWPIISGVVQVAWALIKTGIKNALDLVMGIIKTVMKIIQGDWKGAWESIKQTVKNIMDNILSTFKGINLAQIGKDIINGLINGLGSMVDAVKEKVKSLAKLIPDGLKNFLGIHSPSRVTMELGEFTGEGLLIGVEKKIADAKKMALELAKAITPTLPSLDGQVAATTGSFDVAFAPGQVESIQNAFNSSLRYQPQLRGDVYIDGRTAGKLVAPHVQAENDFNDNRVGRLRG